MPYSNAPPHHCANAVRESIVFIVDDDQNTRASVSLLVRSVNLRAEAFSSADEFLKEYDPQQAGCLILDMRMPNMTGLELQAQLNARGVHLPIIMVSGHGEISMATQAMRAGALDFLQKPYSPHLLLERIFEALNADRQQRHRSSAQSSLEYLLATLTEREHEVMLHLAQGKSAKRIGRELGISPKTVDNHRLKVLDKLHIQNTVQLANLVAAGGTPVLAREGGGPHESTSPNGKGRAGSLE